MKILNIVGARPQFIKLGPLSKAIRGVYKEIVVHTGQHYDKTMSENIFTDLDIPEPDYNLHINQGQHGKQTGRMLIEIEKVLIREKPDFVIVFGDTNSTLAGALAAVKLSIKCIHIEAGLRSYNRKMPEEINRVMTDHIADYLFVPTQSAMHNLKIEGLENRSYLTGDIMVDSLKYAIEKSAHIDVLTKLSLIKNRYYLLTLHRPYNVDNPVVLNRIIQELGNLAEIVIFPVHPRTEAIIKKYDISIPINFKIIPPFGYLGFVQLQANAQKIITDSGGIQKEAYIIKKPCITLRSETEWSETVKGGWNLLINPLENNNYYEKIKMFDPQNETPEIFGKDVAKKILKIINNL
ncbi:MAG TPA: UDP-N-acetylglucosamine 2-epimerase (non-hydrolyzing) [Ignavibacteria bacterium]|nr:UDP-N-acetylglucosamine 2-epimerase (non-hydrolyzing) [Ignavibacteria bacterium]